MHRDTICPFTSLQLDHDIKEDTCRAGPFLEYSLAWKHGVPRCQENLQLRFLPRVQIPVTPADGYDHLRLAVPPRCGLRVVCISDTHNAHRDLQLPAGDVLIHAGDFTQFGKEEHASDFNDWLGDARWSVFGAHHFVNCVTSIKLFCNLFYILPYYTILCICIMHTYIRILNDKARHLVST